ncbi:hypothetical protein EJB05_33838, partial [Eragrostis curvula]
MAARLVLCLVILMQVLGSAVGIRPPAMYVFGGLDAGLVSRANRRYYGIDYPLRIPTGRFSNGYNTADYVERGHQHPIVEAGSVLQRDQGSDGRHAATLGSGAAANALLARSIFLVGVGSNDLFGFAAAEQAQNRSAADDVAAFYTSLISNYSAAITELYTMGARRFGIINVGLLGQSISLLHAPNDVDD